MLGVESVEARLLMAGVGFVVRWPAAEVQSAAAASLRFAQQSPANPVGIPNATDPSLIKEGGTYYLFATGPGVAVWSSPDLRHWTSVGPVFAQLPAWALAEIPGATEPWAPAIASFGGQYHLYYAVSTFGGQRSVIGQATNATLDPASPLYHWVDQGPVVSSAPGRTSWNAIDPSILVNGDSTVWLAFGSQWSGIHLAQLDPQTGRLLGRDPSAGGEATPALRLRALASRSPGKPIEAPYLFAHGGYYYLFVSFDNCCMGAQSTYKIMVGRSRSLAGPYVDKSGKPMTRGGGTLVLEGSGRFRGPGSNSVLDDGGTDWLVYHTYDAANEGTAVAQIRPLAWTSSGWPVAGPPLG